MQQRRGSVAAMDKGQRALWMAAVGPAVADTQAGFMQRRRQRWCGCYGADLLGQPEIPVMARWPWRGCRAADFAQHGGGGVADWCCCRAAQNPAREACQGQDVCVLRWLRMFLSSGVLRTAAHCAPVYGQRQRKAGLIVCL